MRKEKIVVPAGIRYISDWAKQGGYSLEKYNYPHIVNKQITGCGFTEYCLTSDFNVVLCSPRKILLENKESQHKSDVLYVNNILGMNDSSSESYDTDLAKENVKTAKQQLENAGYSESAVEGTELRADAMRKSIFDYIDQMKEQGKPYKILVTYDSFRHVKDALRKMKLLQDFFVVVDEFQSIFVDSKFKSTTEIEFSSSLEDIQKLCYVSATPMMDRYLDRLNSFQNLPYYEFDWSSEDSDRVIMPRLTVKATKSVVSEAGRIILEYKQGNWKTLPVIDQEGKVTEIESREAVLYFNSVRHICSLIKKFGLTQEECNVLCARNPSNESLVRKAFGVSKKNFVGVGTVPRRGEKHKMFTFCTRTVYLGADFYSTNARTFIFSDANIKTLAVDISLDLPQILGRQRLDENPWKNSAELYFKPTLPKGVKTQEEFDNYLNEKITRTKETLNAIASLKTETDRKSVIRLATTSAKLLNYADDYVAVNQHKGSEPVAVFNELVMLAEQRAFEIQQIDYKDRFKVFSTIFDSAENTGNAYDVTTDRLTEAMAKFDAQTNFVDKMRVLCTDDFYDKKLRDRLLRCVPDEFVKYVRVLGEDSIRKVGFKRSLIDEEYKQVLSNQSAECLVSEQIYNSFSIGKDYTPGFIKAELKSIFDSCNYKESIRATTLSKYFEIKESKLTIDGTRVRAYRILARNNLK